MSWWSYCRTQGAELVLWVIPLVVITGLLRIADVSWHVLSLVLGIFIVCLVGQFVFRFWRRYSFYTHLATAAEGLDRPYLVPDVVSRPSFIEGQLTWDCLDIALKKMTDHVAMYEKSSKEYREYIETWIHEVKTPIAAAHLVAENNPSAAIDNMDREVSRIEKYVEQALYYARSDALERDYAIAPVTVGELLRGALRRNAGVLVDSGTTIVWPEDTKALDLVVFTDSKWVSFVLGQVLTNSAKYADPRRGARIEFRATQTCDAATAITQTVVEIRDNGIGIPAADVPRVFDKVFTGVAGRHFGQSTGMGLFISKRLCTKMGIDLSLESTEGEGTRVFLRFSHHDELGTFNLTNS